MRLGVDGDFVEHLESVRLGFGASQKAGFCNRFGTAKIPG
jgi:hypothetical protein